MKRVMLIQPKDLQGVEWAFYPPSGLLSLATVLLEKGFDVQLIDVLAEGVTNSQLESLICTYKPDVIGI